MLESGCCFNGFSIFCWQIDHDSPEKNTDIVGCVGRLQRSDLLYHGSITLAGQGDVSSYYQAG
jgi:hypothetical protein